MQLCIVCSEQPPKYRCPACRSRYCSVVCYRKHKDSCLPAQSPPVPPVHEGKGSISTDQSTVDDLSHDEIIDKVPMERLQLLGQSKELQDLLCNPHLRQLMLSIDNSESKDRAIKAAMQTPLFAEFSDCCLKIVDKDDLNNV
ncbi:unnamed protein product [Knipowitschia caucasica]|uniref:Zinc finger HIT domain-containing protein 3 n=1 Tax=Knipowitschia caucasica TaxID=637954 RepID=A0AAV2JCH9_KNICA